MRGVSAKSLQSVLRRAAESTSANTPSTEIASELFEAVRVIDSSNQLVRLLSDPGRDEDLKADVVRRLFGGRVSEAALEVLLEASRCTWSEQNHLLEGIEFAGVSLVLDEARGRGTAHTVEEELFQVARLVEDTPELSEAFDSKRDDVPARVGITERLLGGKVDEATVSLAAQAVSFEPEAKVPARLLEFANFASAERDRRSGVVTSAIALSPEQQERLTRILSARYGGELSLNYEIDPSVIGGLRITIGDDLYDATIFGRVRDARERISA